jgi:hypothetical protein
MFDDIELQKRNLLALTRKQKDFFKDEITPQSLVPNLTTEEIMNNIIHLRQLFRKDVTELTSDQQIINDVVNDPKFQTLEILQIVVQIWPKIKFELTQGKDRQRFMSANFIVSAILRYIDMWKKDYNINDEPLDLNVGQEQQDNFPSHPLNTYISSGPSMFSDTMPYDGSSSSSSALPDVDPTAFDPTALLPSASYIPAGGAPIEVNPENPVVDLEADETDYDSLYAQLELPPFQVANESDLDVFADNLTNYLLDNDIIQEPIRDDVKQRFKNVLEKENGYSDASSKTTLFTNLLEQYKKDHELAIFNQRVKEIRGTLTRSRENEINNQRRKLENEKSALTDEYNQRLAEISQIKKERAQQAERLKNAKKDKAKEMRDENLRNRADTLNATKAKQIGETYNFPPAFTGMDTKAKQDYIYEYFSSKPIDEYQLKDFGSRGSKYGFGIQSNSKKTVKIGKGIELKEEKKPAFVNFGRFVIAIRQLLNDSILNLKYDNMGPTTIKRQLISKDLVEMLDSILKYGSIKQRDYDSLTDADKKLFDEIIEKAHLSDIVKYQRKVFGNGILNADALNINDQMQRFKLLQGEIVAGNDNKDVMNEFKSLLQKFIDLKRIDANEGQAILKLMK